LIKIYTGVRNELDFDRVGLFIYDASHNAMRGTFGTDRDGKMREEWDLVYPIGSDAFMEVLFSRKDGYDFTMDYENERSLYPNPGMSGVKYHAAVSAWAGDKPVAIISVDQLVSGRQITVEQLEALRLFAGYAGLAIENARLKSELEHRVHERTAELEAANRELESFSYSVSHDLRAPLRVINGFSKILSDDFAAELSPPAQGFIRKIRDSGTKMGELIEALLAFSRLGRKPLLLQPVDLNALVQSTLETLSLETSNRQVEWVLTDLPPTRADPALLQQVYANLIGNAIKYSRKRDLARIEIGSFEQDGELVYFVRDNGAGFDLRFADRLFGVFQRLHREDEFEGTGIGLATVQRIIQRHGGRVWAEAVVDQGATFYFTLAPSLH
jgi:signal transduction histidine kinase